MASVSVMTDPPTDIDYSVMDGRVRSFKLMGKLLFDEDKEIVTDGWEKQLARFVKDQGLDKDDGRGLHAFVYKLQEDGLLK